MSEERKPLWPWIVALLIGLPVLYVASFGPACWLVRRNQVDMTKAARIYRPLVRTACSTSIFARPLRWYGDPFAPTSAHFPITNWMNLALDYIETAE